MSCMFLSFLDVVLSCTFMTKMFITPSKVSDCLTAKEYWVAYAHIYA